MPVEKISGLSNEEFFERYAAPGRIGLVGGTSPICRLIRHTQRHLDEGREASRWSHAFILQGRRRDGQHWVVESDLEMRRKHIALGVQENRTVKFFDAGEFPQIAILDMGLDEAQTDRLLTHAYDMVVGKVRYSLRELVGTLMALRHPRLRPRDNLMARDHSAYCSAFVRQLFQHVGYDLTPGLEIKNTTPEDLCRTPLATHTWILERPEPPPRPLLRRLKDKRAKAKGKKAKHKPDREND